MSISSEEAAAALREIQRAEVRSATLSGYHHASPHLILWGVLWAAGYGLTHAMPAYAPAIWTVAVAIGFGGGLAMLLRGGHAFSAWRYAVASAALVAFCLATLAIFAPMNGRQVAAFIPLLVATSYVLGGLWWGLRFIVAGSVLAALTLIGFFLLRDHFLLWMAAVGAGALLIAGLWLRRV